MERNKSETRAKYEYSSALVRLPTLLHRWFKVQAAAQRRSINTVILIALEEYYERQTPTAERPK